MIHVATAHAESERARARPRRFVLALATILAVVAVGPVQAADPLPVGVRAAKAVHGFDEVWQWAAIHQLPSPQALRARHLELAVGVVSGPTKTRPFVSLGPVWRLSRRAEALFLDLGFSVTLLGGSDFGGRDLGGNLHFTSSVALGTRFGGSRRYSLALRFQHTSNGGLNDANPGLDAIALNFTVDVPRR